MGISQDLFCRLAADEVVVLDGAVSTELQRRRVPVDEVSWFGSANRTHLEFTRALAEGLPRRVRARRAAMVTGALTMFLAAAMRSWREGLSDG